jgi:outer membrane receptor for ferrienterochelin and colicin
MHRRQLKGIQGELMRLLPFAVAGAVVLTACGASRKLPGADRDREVITAEEIQASNARDAYDAIRKLRANFLSYRGRTTINTTAAQEPIVFVDEQRYGTLSSLRTIPAGQIAEIKLYRAWEATQKFGTGYTGGVIHITTTR